MEDLKLPVTEADGRLLENLPTAKHTPKSSDSESLLSLPQRKGKEKQVFREIGQSGFHIKKSINYKLSVKMPANRASKSAHNQQIVNTSSETDGMIDDSILHGQSCATYPKASTEGYPTFPQTNKHSIRLSPPYQEAPEKSCNYLIIGN